MESAYYVSQIISSVFVITGAVFAVIQYKKQRKLTRISNAIDLAKYFATDIIDRACLVYAVFRDDKEIMAIIDKHLEEIQDAKYINSNEYEQIFSQEEREKYDKFLDKKIKISEDKVIELSDILQDTINELEHCSISFNTGLAEEKAVYQSMHQVILNLFPCAYPWIGSINQNGVDLYYTNLSELYARWTQIRKKALKKEAKASKKLEKYRKNYNNSGKIKSPKV